MVADLVSRADLPQNKLNSHTWT